MKSQNYQRARECPSLKTEWLMKYSIISSLGVPYRPNSPSLSYWQLQYFYDTQFKNKLQKLMSYPFLRQDMLAIPPKLINASPANIYSPNGANGAPWPPLHTSNSLKLPQTSTLSCPARQFKLSTWTVMDYQGWWNMVCPWTESRSQWKILNWVVKRLSVSMMNLVQRSQSFLNYKKVVLGDCILAMNSVTYLGYSKVRHAIRWQRQGDMLGNRIVLRVNQQKAKSTPSSEVPDIIPITFIEVQVFMQDLLIYISRKLYFNLIENYNNI